MASFKELALQYLTAKNIRSEDLDDFALRVIFSGNNCNEIRILIVFDDDGSDKFFLKCVAISNANFNGKEAAGLALCNNLNSHYRWVKFYLTEEADISAIVDGIVDTETCGDEVYRLLMLIVGIIDEAYPDIMRARFA